MDARYKFHCRATTALHQLGGDEQTQVADALAGLLDVPASHWPRVRAKEHPGDPPLYLVRVNDSLRALVRAPAGHEPEVMDLVRHETLESFKATSTNGG